MSRREHCDVYCVKAGKEMIQPSLLIKKCIKTLSDGNSYFFMLI